MFKNRISRTTTTTTTPGTNRRHPQFFIRRSEIAFDHRVAYIESVCATLVESRFGPGRVTPVVINLSDRPELEPAVFYDLCDDGMVPSYELSPLGRKNYQLAEAAYRRAKKMGLVDAVPNALNSAAALAPNLGRGSP